MKTTQTLKRIFMWILVFPIIFEKLNKALENQDAEKSDHRLLREKFEKLFLEIEINKGQSKVIIDTLSALHEAVANINNTTYLYTRKGEMLNLGAYRDLSIELTLVPGINNNNSLKIDLYAEKKVIEEIEFKLSEALEKIVKDDDKQLYEYIIKYFAERQVNREKIANGIRSNLIQALKNHYTLSYRQFAGLSIHVLIEEHREAFEASYALAKKEITEKYQLDVGINVLGLLEDAGELAITKPQIDTLTEETSKKIGDLLVEYIVLRNMGLKKVTENKSIEIASELCGKQAISE